MRCIVSCAVGGRYRPYGERLLASLHEPAGYTGSAFVWFDQWPPGSPAHRDMHYAFKFYAVKDALERGYTRVMWLDSAVYAVQAVENVWEETSRRGIYVAAGDEPLGEWISDQALDYFKVGRDEAMKERLCGGAIVGLDLAHAAAQEFFEWWGRLAKSGLFVTAHSKHAPDRMRSLLVSDLDEGLVLSSDPRVKGHRSDEACYALMLKRLGVAAVKAEDWNRYMRSGYNL